MGPYRSHLSVRWNYTVFTITTEPFPYHRKKIFSHSVSKLDKFQNERKMKKKNQTRNRNQWMKMFNLLLKHDTLFLETKHTKEVLSQPMDYDHMSKFRTISWIQTNEVVNENERYTMLINISKNRKRLRANLNTFFNKKRRFWVWIFLISMNNHKAFHLPLIRFAIEIEF